MNQIIDKQRDKVITLRDRLRNRWKVKGKQEISLSLSLFFFLPIIERTKSHFYEQNEDKNDNIRRSIKKSLEKSKRTQDLSFEIIFSHSFHIHGD